MNAAQSESCHAGLSRWSNSLAVRLPADAQLIAAALIACSKRLYCEDLQHGQLIDRQLRVINPLVAR